MSTADLSGSSPGPVRPRARRPSRDRAPDGTGAPLCVLVCMVEGHRVGLPVDRVDSVERAAEPDPLPDAPRHVEGVINVHGEVRPLFDLRGRCGLTPEPLHPSQHFVLARSRARGVALRVDEATAVLELAGIDLRSAEEAIGVQGAAAGIGILDDGLVLIHDLDAFLDADEAIRLESAIARLEDRAEGGSGPVASDA